MARRSRPNIMPGFLLPQDGARSGGNGHLEADFQKRLVVDLRAILPPPCLVHASNIEVNEGGERGALLQALAKAMGAVTGHTDLTIYAPGPVTLVMEIKIGRNTLSKGQREFRDRMVSMGYAWAEVRSLDDALAALRAAGIKTRIVGD